MLFNKYYTELKEKTTDQEYRESFFKGTIGCIVWMILMLSIIFMGGKGFEYIEQEHNIKTTIEGMSN